MHAFSPSTGEAEVGRPLWIQGQPDLCIIRQAWGRGISKLLFLIIYVCVFVCRSADAQGGQKGTLDPMGVEASVLDNLSSWSTLVCLC